MGIQGLFQKGIDSKAKHRVYYPGTFYTILEYNCFGRW